MIDKKISPHDDNHRVDTYTVRVGDSSKGKECILLFSGGLDTSCMLKYIQEKYQMQVITLLFDIGQMENFEAIAQKAYFLGAKEHITYDAKEEFVKNYLWKAILLNSFYNGNHPIASSLSRQLITKIAVRLAIQRGIGVIAHGATGKGNDSFRFDNGILIYSNDQVKVLAPVREWGMSREEELVYARERCIPVDATKQDFYSIDENMWGREIEAGGLDDLNFILPENVYKWTESIENVPDTPGFVEIEFKSGIPRKIVVKENKQSEGTEIIDSVEMIRVLNNFVGKHGVGRYDCLEERAAGFKVREIHESPAATVLIKGHQFLESAILTVTEIGTKKIMEEIWIKKFVTGYIDPILSSIEAFATESNRRVSGKIGFKLLKGNIFYDTMEVTNGIDFGNMLKRGFITELNQMAVPSAIEFTTLGSRGAFYCENNVTRE